MDTQEVANTVFPLVLKLVTLNDLEQRNARYFALFHRIRYLWGSNYVTGVEVIPTLSPKESTFRQCNTNFMVIFSR